MDQDFNHYPGWLILLVGFSSIFLGIAALAMPLYVYGIYCAVRRIEKLHRKVAEDIVNELRRLTGRL